MLLSSAAHSLIGIDPAVRGGRPCIAGTSVSVRDVPGWLGRSMSVAEILERFPQLTAANIAAAQAYVADCLPSYRTHQLPDFCVTYRLLTEAEGGRRPPAYQHIRWDLRYAEGTVSKATWMLVYPEFLDPDGQMLPNGPFSPVGQADRFVGSPSQRKFHRQHIRPGVRGYFAEGPERVGVGEVAEVLELRRPPASGAGK